MSASDVMPKKPLTPEETKWREMLKESIITQPRFLGRLPVLTLPDEIWAYLEKVALGEGATIAHLAAEYDAARRLGTYRTPPPYEYRVEANEHYEAYLGELETRLRARDRTAYAVLRLRMGVPREVATKVLDRVRERGPLRTRSTCSCAGCGVAPTAAFLKQPSY